MHGKPMGQVWGIVLAAGSGRRYGGWKQFAEVGGRRLIDRLVEAAGGTVAVVPGDPRNLHVTRPEDLDLVARLLAE